MDAERRSRRLLRVAIAWLATVLAIGLWQAYGAWLFANESFEAKWFGSGAGHGL